MVAWKKRSIGWALAAALVAGNASPAIQSLRDLPDRIHMAQGQQKVIELPFFAALTLEQPAKSVAFGQSESLGEPQQALELQTGEQGATLLGQKQGEATVTLRLLGVPVKEVAVNIEPDRRLIPGGHAVGIAMYTKGVYVVELAEIFLPDGTSRNPAREAGLLSGDSILAVEGEPITTMEQLTGIVKNTEKTSLQLKVQRAGKVFETKITPVVDEEGIKRVGLWARDSTAGIGTLTYVDAVNNSFGALGHAITDMDTMKKLTIRDGDVYLTRVMDVKKGEKGSPGELHGVFNSSMARVCSIDKNTDYGVFGHTLAQIGNELYPQGLLIGGQSVVHTGEAQILSTIDGSGVRAFDCRILKVTPQLSAAQRSLVVQIVDPELLAATGGIVQGMSGSPILQDGRIIGAVTHVYVNDPTKGYGVFIDWMLDQQAA